MNLLTKEEKNIIYDIKLKYMTNLIGVSGKIGSNFRNIWKNVNSF